MKERKKLLIISIIFIIASMIGGFFVGWNFLAKPLNDSQFKMCEELAQQLAQDVYEIEGNNHIVNVSGGFSVDINENTITVELDSDIYTYRGKVVAKLQNGELELTRKMETESAIFISISIAFLSGLGGFFIIVFCYAYRKEKQSQFVEWIEDDSDES